MHVYYLYSYLLLTSGTASPYRVELRVERLGALARASTLLEQEMKKGGKGTKHCVSRISLTLLCPWTKVLLPARARGSC